MVLPCLTAADDANYSLLDQPKREFRVGTQPIINDDAAGSLAPLRRQNTLRVSLHNST